MIRAAGLEIVEDRELVHPLEARGSDDAWNALYESGWAIGSLSRYPTWKLALTRGLFGVLDFPGLHLFPFRFNASISVILARKPG